MSCGNMIMQDCELIARQAKEIAELRDKVDALNSNGIWVWQIGAAHTLPWGSDEPMRAAIAEAYLKLTGKKARFIHSSWKARTGQQHDDLVVVKRELTNHITPPASNSASAND